MEKERRVVNTRGLQRRKMMDEKDESRKMTEQNECSKSDGWIGTITTITVLLQRLEGQNEYK